LQPPARGERSIGAAAAAAGAAERRRDEIGRERFELDVLDVRKGRHASLAGHDRGPHGCRVEAPGYIQERRAYGGVHRFELGVAQRWFEQAPVASAAERAAAADGVAPQDVLCAMAGADRHPFVAAPLHGHAALDWTLLSDRDLVLFVQTLRKLRPG
jgi:hypothetical protein